MGRIVSGIVGVAKEVIFVGWFKDRFSSNKHILDTFGESDNLKIPFLANKVALPGETYQVIGKFGVIRDPKQRHSVGDILLVSDRSISLTKLISFDY